jgi:hypothetical protein
MDKMQQNQHPNTQNHDIVKVCYTLEDKNKIINQNDPNITWRWATEEERTNKARQHTRLFSFTEICRWDIVNNYMEKLTSKIKSNMKGKQ